MINHYYGLYSYPRFIYLSSKGESSYTHGGGTKVKCYIYRCSPKSNITLLVCINTCDNWNILVDGLDGATC